MVGAARCVHARPSLARWAFLGDGEKTPVWEGLRLRCWGWACKDKIVQ